MGKQYFCGFEPSELKRRLKLIQLRADASPPAIYKLHDVVALPGIKGLIGHDGQFIEQTGWATLSHDAPHALRGKLHSKLPSAVKKLPEGLRTVEDTVLFGGYLFSHYGHFLIDGMSRLWARNLFPRLPIVFTKPCQSYDHLSHSSQIFSALELSSRIRTVEEPTIFREVICPATSFEYRWKVYSVADEPHMKAAARIGGGRTWPRPVYLTRTRLPDEIVTRRGVTNQIRKSSYSEPELETELSSRGVDVISPETLSLAEQVSLFRDASLVIGTTGSAFHTALFSRSSNLRLGIFNWGRGSENHLLVDGLKQHTSYYFKSMKSTELDGQHHDLDVGLSLRLLEEAGLIDAQTRIGAVT